MKKLYNLFKKNIKLIIGITLGIMISGIGVYAATSLYGANEVNFDNTAANLKIVGTNNNVTNVKEALDALYEKASNASSGPDCAFKQGDYISLTPTATSFIIKTATTGYDNDQTINPSELNLWRVIDINSDCSFDVVSEYVSSTEVNFKGVTGYANFVGELQTIAASYAKPGYTISTRMMGYAGQTSTIVDTSAFDGTTNTALSETTTPSPTTGTGQEYSDGVLGDTLYIKDYLLVSNVYKSDTATYGSTGLIAYNVSNTSLAKAYWVASRSFYWMGASSFLFSGHYVATNGNLSYVSIRYFLGSWTDYSRSNSLRPILTLKSGITKSGGEGTKVSPYTLSG